MSHLGRLVLAKFVRNSYIIPDDLLDLHVYTVCNPNGM